MVNKKPSPAEKDALLIADAVELFGRRCKWSAAAWLTGRASQDQAEQFLIDDFEALRAKIALIRKET